MYLPESDAQLRDILIAVRLYAAENGLSRLAEELDDALMVLETETRRNRTAAKGTRAVSE